MAARAPKFTEPIPVAAAGPAASPRAPTQPAGGSGLESGAPGLGTGNNGAALPDPALPLPCWMLHVVHWEAMTSASSTAEIASLSRIDGDQHGP